MIDVFLYPILWLIGALIASFFDTKKNPHHLVSRLLMISLILVAIASGWIAWEKRQSAEELKQRTEELAVQGTTEKHSVSRELSGLQSRVGEVRSAVDTRNEQLEKAAELYSQRSEKQSSELLANTEAAHAKLIQLFTETLKATNRNITVQFVPDVLNRDVMLPALLSRLGDAGFNLAAGIGHSSQKGTPTNSIWYGSDVPVDSVRVVALALIGAGVNVRGIQPYSSDTQGSKGRLIQIGSDPLIQANPPYTVGQVSNMSLPNAVPSNPTNTAPVYGCMDSTAINFNRAATNQAGACTYPIHGCMDFTATNYVSSATDQTGVTCTYGQQ